MISKQQEVDELKFRTYYNIEMVNDKPGIKLTVFPEQVNLYNQTGEKCGVLLDTPVVYTSDTLAIFSDSLLPVRVYGWVWSLSLDDKGKLLTDENIRYWSNSHIIARLNAGFALDTICTNELKTWILVTFIGFVPGNCLFTPEQFKQIYRLKRFFLNVTQKETVTRRVGGVSIKPTTRPLIYYDHFIWPIRLVFSVWVFIGMMGLFLRLYIPHGTQNPKKKIYRFIILFLSGFAAGTIFWFIRFIISQLE